MLKFVNERTMFSVNVEAMLKYKVDNLTNTFRIAIALTKVDNLFGTTHDSTKCELYNSISSLYKTSADVLDSFATVFFREASIMNHCRFT